MQTDGGAAMIDGNSWDGNGRGWEWVNKQICPVPLFNRSEFVILIGNRCVFI